MSSHIFNINKGIIIQHIKDTSDEYIDKLYNNLDDNIKNKISIDDITEKLIVHILKLMSDNSGSESSRNESEDKPDCFDVLDKWIVFGGRDFEIFLSNFISSFDNVNLKNGLSKGLIKLCEHYDLL